MCRLLYICIMVCFFSTACDTGGNSATDHGSSHVNLDISEVLHDRDTFGGNETTESPERFSPVTVIDLPNDVRPTGIAAAGDRLYIGDIERPSILEMRLSSGTLLNRNTVRGIFPTGIDHHDGVLFTADLFEDTVSRITSFPNRKKMPLPFYGGQLWGVTAGENNLFLVDRAERVIKEVDARDGSVIEQFPAPGKKPSAVVRGDDGLWVADADSRKIYLMDPDNHWIIHSVSVPVLYPSGLTVSDKTLFVSDLTGQKIIRVDPFPGPSYTVTDKKQYEVRFTMRSRVSGTGAAVNMKSIIAIPVTRPGQTILGTVSFSPEPDTVVTDSWGQRFAVFSHGRVAAGHTVRTDMTVRIATGDLRYAINPARVPDDPTEGLAEAEARKYLADTVKYDTVAPVVQKKVKKIMVRYSDAGTYERARKIYEELAGSITYDRTGGWGRASTVLERGTGSCSEYTFALVSLYRAAGIPARYVGAFVNRTETGGIDYVFHRWAEIWLGPRYGWVPVDANAGSDDDILTRAAAFGGLSGRFLVTTESGGGSRHMKWSYNYDVDYDIEGGAVVETYPVAVWKPLTVR